MPTVHTVTVGPGKTYATLQAAIAAEVADHPDLVAEDIQQTFECYAGADTTAATLAGFTADATRYPRIYVPPAERHDGKRDATAFRLVPTAPFAFALTLSVPYTRVEGLQVSNNNGPGNGGYGVEINAANIRILSALIYDCDVDGVYCGAALGDLILNNIAVMHCGGKGIGRAAVDGNLYVYGATVVGNGGIGIDGDTAFGRITVVKNAYSGGNGGADLDDCTVDATVLTEDGSLSTTTAAYSDSTGVIFTDVTPGTEDPHPSGSSALRDLATNLVGTADAHWVAGAFAYDGVARTGSWDVGAAEFPVLNPTNDTPASIAGGPYVGGTITATPGVWTDADSQVGIYQRSANGVSGWVNIDGATALNYTPTNTDRLQYLRYQETATNGDGSTNQPSNVLGPIGTSVGNIVVRMALQAVVTTVDPEIGGNTLLDRRRRLIRGGNLV